MTFFPFSLLRSRWGFPSLLPFLLALLLAACVSEPVIRIDQAREADFSQYRSYAYYAPLKTDGEPYSSLESQHLKDAIGRRMQQRDYVYREEMPDLLVNFDFVLEDRSDVGSVPAGPVFMPYFFYGGRGGRGGGFGGFYYNTWMGYDTVVDQYTRGTLTVDLIDRRAQKSVWQGVWIKRIEEDARKNSAATIDTAVGAVFARYPYRAGSNLPVVATPPAPQEKDAERK